MSWRENISTGTEDIEKQVSADFEAMKLEYVATQFQSRADNIMEDIRIYAKAVNGCEVDEKALIQERNEFQESLK